VIFVSRANFTKNASRNTKGHPRRSTNLLKDSDIPADSAERGGIFDSHSAKVFSRWHTRLVFRDKLIGGVPKEPRLIEGWLRAKAGLENSEEIRQAMFRTLAEVGVEVTADMTFEQLERASTVLAGRKQTTGFKVGEHGLYVESRQVKAMLKESTNILFGGERWGPTRKGPRSLLAERVFVDPARLWLGVPQPAGVELMIGHLVGPAGPRSTLGYHEYVERTLLDFDVLAVRDSIAPERWADIWLHAQENGFGALRSQGFGRFLRRPVGALTMSASALMRPRPFRGAQSDNPSLRRSARSETAHFFSFQFRQWNQPAARVSISLELMCEGAQ
jgi:hypothetical protein